MRVKPDQVVGELIMTKLVGPVASAAGVAQGGYVIVEDGRVRLALPGSGAERA